MKNPTQYTLYRIGSSWSKWESILVVLFSIFFQRYLRNLEFEKIFKNLPKQQKKKKKNKAHLYKIQFIYTPIQVKHFLLANQRPNPVYENKINFKTVELHVLFLPTTGYINFVRRFNGDYRGLPNKTKNNYNRKRGSSNNCHTVITHNDVLTRLRRSP